MAAVRDALKQTASPEPIVVPPEPMIPKHHGEGPSVLASLTEQRVVRSKSVCTQKQNGKPRCPMTAVETRVAFQNLKKPKWLGLVGKHRTSPASPFPGVKVGRPTLGNEVPLANLQSGQSPVASNTTRGMIEFPLYSGLLYSIIYVHKAM